MGVWSGSGSATVKFDNFVVRSLAAGLAVDGRFTEDVGNVRIDGNALEFHGDGVTRRSVLRHVRLGVGIVQVSWTFQTGIDAGVILNYQDAENFGVALLDNTSSNSLVVRYIEFVDGQGAATRATPTDRRSTLPSARRTIGKRRGRAMCSTSVRRSGSQTCHSSMNWRSATTVGPS